MILVLQIALGVFLANLSAAALTVILQRLAARKRKRVTEDALKLIEALEKASKDVAASALPEKEKDPKPKETKGGQYL